jgi:hypothetical protein
MATEALRCCENRPLTHQDLIAALITPPTSIASTGWEKRIRPCGWDKALPDRGRVRLDKLLPRLWISAAVGWWRSGDVCSAGGDEEVPRATSELAAGIGKIHCSVPCPRASLGNERRGLGAGSSRLSMTRKEW